MAAARLADELAGANLSEPRAIGRGMTVASRAARLRAERQRSIDVRARLGLKGYRKPRLKHIRRYR
jgi:hypothetical protein